MDNTGTRKLDINCIGVICCSTFDTLLWVFPVRILLILNIRAGYISGIGEFFMCRNHIWV